MTELSTWGEDVKGRVSLVGLPLREVFGAKHVTPAEERVLRYVLAFSFSDGGTTSRPFCQRQSVIATRLAYRRETVCRAMRALVQKGLVRVEHRRRRTALVWIASEIRARLLKIHRALRKLGLHAHIERQPRRKWWQPVATPVRTLQEVLAGMRLFTANAATSLGVTKTSLGSKAPLRGGTI